MGSGPFSAENVSVGVEIPTLPKGIHAALFVASFEIELKPYLKIDV